MTDQWAGYKNLRSLGYTHQNVNHSTNFVDPGTGACTNNVESCWARIKRRLKFRYGSQGEMKWSHLDEAMYRDRYRFRAEKTEKKNYCNFSNILQKYTRNRE
ncbi:hypothetical protein Ahia01_000306500 [Argonauta hians]